MRLISFALLGLGIIGSAMGQNCRDVVADADLMLSCPAGQRPHILATVTSVTVYDCCFHGTYGDANCVTDFNPDTYDNYQCPTGKTLTTDINVVFDYGVLSGQRECCIDTELSCDDFISQVGCAEGQTPNTGVTFGTNDAPAEVCCSGGGGGGELSCDDYITQVGCTTGRTPNTGGTFGSNDNPTTECCLFTCNDFISQVGCAEGQTPNTDGTYKDGELPPDVCCSSGGGELLCDDYISQVGCAVGQTANAGVTFGTSDNPTEVCCSSGGGELSCDDYISQVGCAEGQTANAGVTFGTSDNPTEVCCSSNTNCINSLGLRILGTKCGCDDDCAGNNVCLDNTCVGSSYSATTAMTKNILDTNPNLSSNDYGAGAVPTVDVAAVFSGVSDAAQRQILRRNLARQLKNKGGSAASLGIKVALSDLNLGNSTGKSYIEALMAARNVDEMTIRPAKDKTQYTLDDTDTAACAAADFTESDTEVIECTHMDDGDVCLRCDNGVLVSKSVFNADTNDYSVYCHDGSAWEPADTKYIGETYTCTLNDKIYESAIFSETGGSGGTADGGQCSLHSDCASNVCDNGVCACIEVGQRVLMADGTHKNVEHLVPGDVLRTPDGTTAVRSTRRGGRHLSEVHDVSCNGMTGSITGNHAYHCEGEWRLPQETHEPRALTGTTEVVAVETDNYCEDRMILEGGLHVETWDGRGIDEWRPHTYENGRRLRCTLKGTWRDRVLKRVDSNQ